MNKRALRELQRAVRDINAEGEPVTLVYELSGQEVSIETHAVLKGFPDHLVSKASVEAGDSKFMIAADPSTLGELLPKARASEEFARGIKIFTHVEPLEGFPDPDASTSVQWQVIRRLNETPAPAGVPILLELHGRS